MRETVLTEGDKQTQVWQKIAAHLEARLQELRVQNDTEADAVHTARTRGRIAEIKDLLRLGDAPRVAPPDMGRVDY